MISKKVNFAPPGLNRVHPDHSRVGRSGEPAIWFHLRNKVEGEIYYKTVRNDSLTWRRVYYNNKGVQIGVIHTFTYESEPDIPVEWHPFRVSSPVEHSRRHLHYRSLPKAEIFLRREVTPLGRFLNSLRIILTAGSSFARTGYL
jgi:hypothetical protein